MSWILQNISLALIFHHKNKTEIKGVQLLHYRFKVSPITKPVFPIYGKVCCDCLLRITTSADNFQSGAVLVDWF